jgi:NADH:ubiquinone oxidoreductase subunit E
MNIKDKTRRTRAESEGILYKLPDIEESRVFEKRIQLLVREPGELLEALHIAQESYGYLPKPVMGWLAQEFKIPRSTVYSTATFYSMYSLVPQAKYVISVCDSLPCHLQGDDIITDAIRDSAGIAADKLTSDDGLFALRAVSCLGLCEQAPAMMINRETYGLLTTEKVRHIIANLRNGER